MKSKRTYRALLVFGCWVSLGLFCGQASAVEFSADLVQTRGGETSQGKFYLKGDKHRTEITEAGQSSIMIMDVSNKKSYMLNPKDKTYMDLSAMGMGGGQTLHIGFAHLDLWVLSLPSFGRNAYEGPRHRVQQGRNGVELYIQHQFP